ncbi:MAG: hypothetical protein ACO3SP_00625 [Ilumatobacteraceae bacterium]
MIRRITGIAVVLVGLLNGPMTMSVTAGSTGASTIHLVSQMSFLPGDENSLLRLSFTVDRSDAAPVEVPSVLIVSTHRPVDTREEVRAAASGELPRTIDTIRLDLSDQVGAEGGPLDVLIVSEVSTRNSDRLQFPDPGIYPVTVSWEEDGVITSTFTTFVERLAAGALAPQGNDGLRLSVIGQIDSDVTLQPDSTTVISDGDREEITDLVSVVETLPDLPVTVTVRPELIDALDRSDEGDAALLARLQASASLRVLSNTFVDVDPSDLAVPSGSEIFRRQLRLGEDVIAGLPPNHISPRLTWFQNRALSESGGVLLAELGLRTVVFGLAAQQDTADGAALLADSTRKIELRLSDDTSVTAALIDGPLSEVLDGREDPALVAQRVLAELKALLLELERDNDSVAGRGVLLSTPDGSLPGPDMLTALFRAVADDPRLTFVSVENLVTTMSVSLVDGRPVVVDLPRSNDLPAPAGAPQIADLTATVDAFSSMLPDGDYRPRRWRRLLDVLPHHAFTDEQRNAYASIITGETFELAASVSPPMATTFTLGGRSSPLRFSIRNDGDTDLLVRIRLTSAKLRLPDGEKVVLVPARSSTAVDMPVVARSNGRFPVSLQMFTPEGNVPISPVATLTARVNALAGLGQLVTGIALLLLLSWWVSHFRRQHVERQSRAARASGRHPSEKHLK